MRTEIPAKTVVTCDRCKKEADNPFRQNLHDFCEGCYTELQELISGFLNSIPKDQPIFVTQAPESTPPSAQEARAEPIIRGWVCFHPASGKWEKNEIITEDDTSELGRKLANGWEWRKVEVIPAREEKA